MAKKNQHTCWVILCVNRGSEANAVQVKVFKDFIRLLRAIDPRWLQRKDMVFGALAVGGSCDCADSLRPGDFSPLDVKNVTIESFYQFLFSFYFFNEDVS